MSSTSTTLVVQTAMQHGSSVAIFDGDRLILSRDWDNMRRTGALLLPGILEMLTVSGLKPQDVDTLFFANGPGSFTGLRVGLSLLKGLFFAHSLDYSPVSTLDALAANVDSDFSGTVYPMIFYRRGAVFSTSCKIVDKLPVRSSETEILDSDAISRLESGSIILGEFAGIIPEEAISTGEFSGLTIPPSAQNRVTVENIYKLGKRELAQNGPACLSDAEPDYLADFIPGGGTR